MMQFNTVRVGRVLGACWARVGRMLDACWARVGRVLGARQGNVSLCSALGCTSLNDQHTLPCQNSRTQVREAIANVLSAIVMGARQLPLRESEKNPLLDYKVQPGGLSWYPFAVTSRALSLTPEPRAPLNPTLRRNFSIFLSARSSRARRRCTKAPLTVGGLHGSRAAYALADRLLSTLPPSLNPRFPCLPGLCALGLSKTLTEDEVALVIGHAARLLTTEEVSDQLAGSRAPQGRS